MGSPAGEVALDPSNSFQARPPAEELLRCQRHYYKSYNAGIVPGSSGVGGAPRTLSTTASPTSGRININFSFPVDMHKIPTCAAYSTTGAINSMRDLGGGVDLAADVVHAGTKNACVRNTATGVASRPYSAHLTAEASLGT